MYPISLKQITGDGSIEYNNLTNKKIEYNFLLNKLPCDFRINEDGLFVTKEIGVISAINTDSQKQMNFQVRGFPHKYGLAQTEITSSGELTGGRVGKIPTKDIEF